MATNATLFIDGRDGLLTLCLHGRALGYESVPSLALAAYTYGVEFVDEPPDAEEWPDYVRTDARLLMQVNEELRVLHDDARERFGASVFAA